VRRHERRGSPLTGGGTFDEIQKNHDADVAATADWGTKTPEKEILLLPVNQGFVRTESGERREEAI